MTRTLHHEHAQGVWRIVSRHTGPTFTQISLRKLESDGTIRVERATSKAWYDIQSWSRWPCALPARFQRHLTAYVHSVRPRKATNRVQWHDLLFISCVDDPCRSCELCSLERNPQSFLVDVVVSARDRGPTTLPRSARLAAVDELLMVSRKDVFVAGDGGLCTILRRAVGSSSFCAQTTKTHACRLQLARILVPLLLFPVAMRGSSRPICNATADPWNSFSTNYGQG